jgi:pimeloyl-ACP methyl ester carboxylesterase
MHGSPRRRRRLAGIGCALLAALLSTAPVASAQRNRGARAAALNWKDCGKGPDVAKGDVQCATQRVPLDYDHPRGRHIRIAVARVPAKDKSHRIGSLFFNLGGPGAPAVDLLQTTAAKGLLDALNRRFDIVAFDPRGVGKSSPSIDCRVNQETQGPGRQPFPTPFTLHLRVLLGKDRAYLRRCLRLNRSGILAHVSTADVARDLNVLRAAVGDRKLTYLGYSYGTFLGATYAALFPNRFRALVLDGPVDAAQFLSRPLEGSAEQTAAFERAFARFLQACAADQTTCLGFGGTDPWAAYDDLVRRMRARPLPATGYAPDPRPVDGDDLNAVSTILMYNKGFWPLLAQALATAAQGDGSLVRAIVDELVYSRNPNTGRYDPETDRFVAIYGAEGRWPTDIRRYVREGDEAWGMFDHFYSNHGYSELNFGLWPVRAQDVYRGPFRIRASARKPLVVATRYDPATPYRGALRLVAELHNARLLTMRGDGHTAYPGNSACVDDAVNAYLIDGKLPRRGKVCRQEVPFAQPSQQAAAGTAGAAQRAVAQVRATTLHNLPLVP